MPYSIIIPIFNEQKTIIPLINELKRFSDKNNEIILINDGSSDDTSLLLKKYGFIKKIHLKKNFGKGIAIKVGLCFAKYNKVIIFDGDLELNTNDISKLMKLNHKKGISSIMGIRSKSFNPFNFGNDWGNFIFTFFFNILHFSTHKDILCCAKAFYKDQIPIEKIKSKSFDIDVELSYLLTKNNKDKNILQVPIKYIRRTVKDGKKLKTSDGWVILNRMLLNLFYH